MVSRKKVCVIGAGVSGLAAAKAFAARGHQITIVERSGDLGGVWEPARSYPEVQTQSPKDLYRYTDKAMPDSYPEWLKGPQVHAYLTEYAKDSSASRPTWPCSRSATNWVCRSCRRLTGTDWSIPTGSIGFIG
jgi:cation diffusion facilitator CzcD-associated flavoprotein CzcO